MLSLTMEEAQARLGELLNEAATSGRVSFLVDGQRVFLVASTAGEGRAPQLSEVGLLAHLDADRVLRAYADAPGNELETKFRSPESSSCLAANAFGQFLDRAESLPPLPGLGHLDWPAQSVVLEGVARFPWAGGRHPCLDVLVQTSGDVVGIESKRYEPFRSHADGTFSDAYSRPVWGEGMRGYEGVRDAISAGSLRYRHLDAVQLVKHAFGLRTMATGSGKRGTLVYLHAEPVAWPDGRPITDATLSAHRDESADFGTRVTGDEVSFLSLTYDQMLSQWEASDDVGLAEHAWQVRTVFTP